MLLGIDVGGTHTDAVVVGKDGLVASAKAKTRHDDLLSSIREALENVLDLAGPVDITRLNLSTTLTTNAIVQGQTEPVGVFVAAGPGIDPLAYDVGQHYFVIPGSTDHRGQTTAPLDLAKAREGLAACRQAGVRVFAGIGKFSPRNPEFEESLKEVLHPQADFVSLGHEFSGRLGFGRRIHTAYYNAAAWRLFNRFADAVQQSALKFGIKGQVSILKADGGTMPLSMSRTYPVESILSGPAASVMGIIAACDITCDSLILDIGGTTTDLAVFASGAPIVESGGAVISGRPTLVRSLKTRSIGIGGDSAVTVQDGQVLVGPKRLGPAMAEGGVHPTLVDALNVLGHSAVGDSEASARGLGELAASLGQETAALAQTVADKAVETIKRAAQDLLAEINDRPVYTIYELLVDKALAPQRLYVMGGPAQAMSGLLAQAFGQSVVVPKNFAVCNAIGAALTRPTLSAELFADTSQGRMLMPALDVEQAVTRSYGLDQAKEDAARFLREYLEYLCIEDPQSLIETTEAMSFNMVEDGAMVGRNIRVKCQIKPGVLPAYRQAVKCQS